MSSQSFANCWTSLVARTVGNAAVARVTAQQLYSGKPEHSAIAPPALHRTAQKAFADRRLQTANPPIADPQFRRS